MIPPLDPTSGHLPVGRFRTDLDEVHQRFVAHPEFAGCPRRAEVWSGFEEYLDAWGQVEDLTDTPGIVLALWLGGSFASGKPDPDDIDVSPLLDASKLDAIRGRSGAGQANSLLQHRTSIRSRYHVEVFPILWRASTTSIFRPGSDHPQRDYLLRRGSMDDWWQRVSPHGNDKGPPTADSAWPRRGYLEVMV